MGAGILAFGLGALALGACSSPDTGIDEGAAVSCEGTTFYKDANGRCHREDNGRFAPKVCCAEPEVLPYPTVRRSLEAYACPNADEVDAVAVAFFDADSTLRVSRSGSPSANDAEDVYVLPFAAQKIKALQDMGYVIAVASNQGGVANGFVSLEEAELALAKTVKMLHEMGGKVDYFDFAEAYDENRKPKVGAEGGTGMADRLVGLLEDKCGLSVAWDMSMMIGDAGYKKNQDENHPWMPDLPADDFSNSDRGFALNLGIDFYEPAQPEAFDWAHFGVYNVHNKWNLMDFYAAIEAEIAELDDSGDDPERAEMLVEEVALGRALNELYD